MAGVMGASHSAKSHLPGELAPACSGSAQGGQQEAVPKASPLASVAGARHCVVLWWSKSGLHKLESSYGVTVEL